MSPEDIGRDFVACPGWEWLAGMLDETGCRIVLVDSGTVTLSTAEADGLHERPDDRHWGPDASDPQTLAIIAHVLLPKRWPGHSVQVEMFPDRTVEIVVKCSEGWGRMKVQRGPVAVSLLRALEASS